MQIREIHVAREFSLKTEVIDAFKPNANPPKQPDPIPMGQDAPSESP